MRFTDNVAVNPAVMETDNIPPPHLSAEEHLVRINEEQLLKDGRQWLSRAIDLYTQTPKIKIWVPVAGSIIMTCYSLYMIHSRSAGAAELATPVAEPSPVAVVVADETPLPKAPPFTHASVAPAMTSAADSVDSEADLMKRAQQAHGSQQFSEEANLLQQVLDHSHSPQQVCPAIGKAYEHAGAIDLSLKAYERCAALGPDNVDTLVAFAHELQAKPDFKRASSLYHQCLLKDPGNLDAKTGLALVELKQNHLQQADEQVLAVLHKFPDNTDALLVAGIVAWRQAKLDEAQKIFSKGVEVDEHRADFHAFLGRIAEAQKRPQDALRQYERALVLDPNDVDITDRRDRLKDMR